MTSHLTIAALLMAGTAAHAVEPVGADAFNTTPDFDLATLNAEEEFAAEQVSRLIPTNQFATRSLPQMPSALKSAMKDYFIANVLRN